MTPRKVFFPRSLAALAFALAPSFLFAQDSPPVKIQFEVENLLPQNAKALQAQLKIIKGVAECAIGGNRVTITVKPEDQLKLSDIKGVIADLKPIKNEKISIKHESIKLEGKVTLSFAIEKNQDKVQGAILSIKTVLSAKASGDGFECMFKSPDGAKLVEIAKMVGTKTESTPANSTALDATGIIKDVVWHGGPKPAEKANPTQPQPNPPQAGQPSQPPPPGAKPPPAPPKGSCGAGGCKPGG